MNRLLHAIFLCLLLIPTASKAQTTIDTIALCAGNSVFISSTSQNGHWHSTDTSIATIDSTSGLIKGIKGGNTIVKYVTATDSDTVAIIVYKLPEPVLTVNAATLGTQLQYKTYQWYKDGDTVIGATNPTYQTTSYGIYTVGVTDVHECEGISQSYIIPRMSVANINGSAYHLSFYPNPASNLININADMPVNAAIYSPDGRQVMKKANVSYLDISHLPGGMYIIYITDNKNDNPISVQKIMKTI